MRKHYRQNGATLPSSFQFKGVVVAGSTQFSGADGKSLKRHASNCLAAVHIGLPFLLQSTQTLKIENLPDGFIDTEWTY